MRSARWAVVVLSALAAASTASAQTTAMAADPTKAFLKSTTATSAVSTGPGQGAFSRLNSFVSSLFGSKGDKGTGNYVLKNPPNRFNPLPPINTADGRPPAPNYRQPWAPLPPITPK